MDARAIMLKLIDNGNVESVSPTCLKPGTRELIIEDFGFFEEYPICIDLGVSQYECVISRDPSRTVDFVVLMNVVSSTIRMLQPTGAIFRAGASLPTDHMAVVAREAGTRMSGWRSEDWSFG